jgi:NADH:ubiquinone oxidoreductase subunit 6 (subunit J)
MFVFIGLEYLGFLLFIIYVGAISIIFSFVVMLLDIRVVSSFFENRVREFLILLFVLGFFILISFFFFFEDLFDFFLDNFFFQEVFQNQHYVFVSNKFNLELFGSILFNKYYIFVYFLALYLLLTVIIVMLIVFYKFSYY